MKLKHKLAWGMVVALSAALVACGGGGGGDTSSDVGTLRVALTDAPACGYEAVNVTIDAVRVHRSASAGDADAGWTEMPVEPARTVDLVTLQNGVLEELGQAALPAGRYQQIRLMLAPAGPSSEPAHTVVPVGGTPQPLQTPSAMQSGLKLNVDMEVLPDQLLDIVLDFHVCESIVRSGNTGRYNLKPVLSVHPRSLSGVSGVLQAGWPAGTQVTLQQGGTVVRSTTPSAAGTFMVQPVAAGTYDVVITAPGQTTRVVTGVQVSADAVTPVNTAASAFPPAASASGVGTASGKVTTAATPVVATTRARQSLAGGTTIEVAAAPVDADTGDYAHELPLDAPLVAAHAAPPASPSFAPDSGAAGKYMVQAVSGGVTKSSATFDLTVTDPATNDFTFP